MDNSLDTFMYAGNAAFTVVSKKSEKHFTFRVKARKDDKKKEGPFFVSVRGSSGEETEQRKNWNFMGTIFVNDGREIYRHGNKSPLPFGNQAEKSFKWVMEHSDSDSFDWKHIGKCGRCARALTDPNSIEQGFGPECINYV